MQILHYEVYAIIPRAFFDAWKPNSFSFCFSAVWNGRFLAGVMQILALESDANDDDDYDPDEGKGDHMPPVLSSTNLFQKDLYSIELQRQQLLYAAVLPPSVRSQP